MKIKYKTINVIQLSDWNKFVSSFYGRPYDFQQQDDCKNRGTFNFKVPLDDELLLDFESSEISEDANDEVYETGVPFQTWLNRDPKQPLKNQEYDFQLNLWWHRNFYPEVNMIINDLYEKGVLETGEYMIEIDW